MSLRTLYLLRHGRADREAWSGPDELRPLTPDGRQRVQQQTRVLAGLALGLERIVTSPLTRARQTAEIVAEGLHLQQALLIDEGLAFGSDFTQFSAVLTSHDTVGSLLLVGHEPDLSAHLGRLIGARPDGVDIKKGALACLTVHLGPEGWRGELRWLLPANLLLSLAGKD